MRIYDYQGVLVRSYFFNSPLLIQLDLVEGDGEGRSSSLWSILVPRVFLVMVQGATNC